MKRKENGRKKFIKKKQAKRFSMRVKVKKNENLEIES